MAKLRVDKIASVGVSTENTGSVFFDGDGDTLEILDPSGLLSLPDSFTVELFVNFSTVTSSVTFVCKTEDDAQYAWFLQYISSSGGIRFYPGTGGGTGTPIVFAWTPSAETWYHLALTRDESNNVRMFVDGIQIGSTGSNSDSLSSTGRITIGDNLDVTGTQELNGYISNLRVLKGTALYTSNFTPPTTELEVTPETVLVACYDGENIFAEKTGKIIAAHGDRTSSPTPTETDSPIGITTENPGLIRSVDNTFGPTFQGGAGYSSQNWLTLPKGTTTERGGDRGFNAGGGYPTGNNIIDYINISSAGNALDFGDLTTGRGLNQGFASNTRGFTLGGTASSSVERNTIDYVTMSSTGNAVDFGDMQNVVASSAGLSNKIRGVMNRSNAASVSLDYVTIATFGDAVDFGDTTGLQGNQMSGQIASPTRGIFSGGAPSSDAINYITIATTGDAQDFGDLNRANEHGHSGGSNTIRGIYGGGTTAPTSIDYITISTLGDALDFGDLTAATRNSAGCASLTRVVIAGRGISTSNTIDYVQIMSTGNAIDFGDATSNTPGAGFSNAHGGLG